MIAAPNTAASVEQLRETAGYLPVGGDRVYSVLHEAAGPRRGMLLLAGAFGGERERAYLTGVHWARRLAQRGFDVLRFDYRGMGESTGNFEKMTCAHWREDIAACVAYLRRRDPTVPIVMHGIRLGAVMMSGAFASGLGDALLLWCTITGARAHLWEYLRRVLGTDLVLDPDAPRKTREEYLADLEAGRCINVDGYFWSGALWADSPNHPLTLPSPQAGSARPWRVFEVRPPVAANAATGAGGSGMPVVAPAAAVAAAAAADAPGGPPSASPAPGQAAKPPSNRQVIEAARFFESAGRVIPECERLYAASIEWLEASVALQTVPGSELQAAPAARGKASADGADGERTRGGPQSLSASSAPSADSGSAFADQVAAANREILSLDVGDWRLVGTAHVPGEIRRGDDVRGRPADRIGVLLLNPGPAPRAGNSDLSVYLCDALAADGFFAFRFDMPGLGDSPGEVPDEVETFWRQVFNGRNDQPALALMRELRRRFDLDGVVVGGLCAGAVTAVRAADIDCSDIAGLLLLEPNFRLSGDMDATAEAAAMAAEAGGNGERSGLRRRVRQGLSLRSWLYLLTRDGRAARLARPLRPWLLAALGGVVGHALPKDANIATVMAWQRVMRRTPPLPTLVITAADKIEDRYCRRILETAPLEETHAVSLTALHATNHIFTAGNAREDAIRSVRNWMRNEFSNLGASQRTVSPR